MQASFVGAMAIADLVKTTLGPKGMVSGNEAAILTTSNDYIIVCPRTAVTRLIARRQQDRKFVQHTLVLSSLDLIHVLFVQSGHWWRAASYHLVADSLKLSIVRVLVLAALLTSGLCVFPLLKDGWCCNLCRTRFSNRLGGARISWSQMMERPFSSRSMWTILLQRCL
jgi:hypothetical protein